MGVDGTLHANLARWLLHNEGLIMEFRYLSVDLGRNGGLPLTVNEVWPAAAAVVRLEVPMSVAKGLHAYLSEVLPKVNRQRIEEDAKWQADRK